MNSVGVSCAWVTPTSVINVPSGSVINVLAVPFTVAAFAEAMMALVLDGVSFW